mgnify:CR=1 FL=1
MRSNWSLASLERGAKIHLIEEAGKLRTRPICPATGTGAGAAGIGAWTPVRIGAGSARVYCGRAAAPILGSLGF